MVKDGKYRFSLQFGMGSEEEVRAGELLERLGNKKSIVIVAALNEYLVVHPELAQKNCKVQVQFTGVQGPQLESIVENAIARYLAENPAIQIRPNVEDSQPDDAKPTQDILDMLNDLELFNM